MHIKHVHCFFAEYEVTSLIAKGLHPQEIALGLLSSVMSRMVGMINRVSRQGAIVFTGGVAKNRCIQKLLAEQYLSTPCSVMSPNTGRFDLLKEMIRDFSVDGVIDHTWQACHTYNVEAYQIDEMIQSNFSFPTLHLETDYAESDTEQLRVRIEAYLEML